MKITLFASNQVRHNYLINLLSNIGSKLFVVQENEGKNSEDLSEQYFSSEESFIDPVCGMKVNSISNNNTFKYRNVDFYFCCSGCKNKFKKDPVFFLEKKLI